MTFSTKSPQITLWSVSMSVAKLALSGSTAHLSPAQVLVQVDRWGEHNVQCATLPLVTSYEIHQTLFCQFPKYTPFPSAILSTFEGPVVEVEAVVVVVEPVVVDGEAVSPSLSPLTKKTHVKRKSSCTASPIFLNPLPLDIKPLAPF